MLLTLRNVPLPDAQQQGALPPPPGIIPNFASPSSIARSFQVGFGVCVGISGLFVITRTYARICVMKRWGLDDCKHPDVAGYWNLTSDQTLCGVLGWVWRSIRSTSAISLRDNRFCQLVTSLQVVGQCPMELAFINGMSMWLLFWNSKRFVLTAQTIKKLHWMDVALERSHDLIQSSHMLYQACDSVTVARHIYASKFAKTTPGLCQSHNREYDFLYYLLFSPYFPMHSTAKDLGPKTARKLHSRANNRHSFGLTERCPRLRHALVANYEDLAAPDFQVQEGGYFCRFRNGIFVSRNSSC